MKKLLLIFLLVLMSYSNLPAQNISGNYQIDSVSLVYTWFTRPMEQLGTDGNYHIAKLDTMRAGYDVIVHWPHGTEGTTDKEWNFSLPVFDPAGGEVIGQRKTLVQSQEMLALMGIKMNVDFYDGGYQFQSVDGEESTYPGSETENCVTALAIQGVDDDGDWTDGGHAGITDQDRKTYYSGWGITRSNVFANFIAPNMATETYGVDYGPGTAQPNWGYQRITYNDDLSQPQELEVGWEAIQGKNSDYGIVDPLDDEYDATEEALGLLNDHFGLSVLPTDSVTIAAMAAICDNLPADQCPGVDVPDGQAYMLKGPGLRDYASPGAPPVIDPNTGQPQGLFASDKGYVFDPTGDLLGGGDGLPFSGDEGLKYTGYYATWNTVVTLVSIQAGIGYANAVNAATQTAPSAASYSAAIMDKVYENFYFDTDSLAAIMLPVDAAGTMAPGTTVIEGALTAKITEFYNAEMDSLGGTVTPENVAKAWAEALGKALPVVQGGLTTLETADASKFEDWYGDSMSVDDSYWDIASDDWYWYDNDEDDDDSAGDSTDASGSAYPRFNPTTGKFYGYYSGGGRIFVGISPACVPMQEMQQVETHWYETSTVSTIADNDIIADKFELLGNFPNPFNPTTKIRFSNDKLSNVEISIYSVNGALAATILNKQLNAGTYDVTWNGRGTGNKVLPSGMYLYRVNSENRVLQGKMLFLK